MVVLCVDGSRNGQRDHHARGLSPGTRPQLLEASRNTVKRDRECTTRTEWEGAVSRKADPLPLGKIHARPKTGLFYYSRVVLLDLKQMNYKVSEGISEKQLSMWLKDAGEKYGKFKDGRVNYTHADIAPVVMITVVCGDELLLAKRGHGLADAEGYWSTINGFIDENKPVARIAAQELKEEIGLQISPQKIKIGSSYTIKHPQEKRSYITFPCLVKLDAKPKVVLDREHTEFTWIKRVELERYHIIDGLSVPIDMALKLL